jgi:hypothetical protein
MATQHRDETAVSDAAEHPFGAWYAALARVGAASCSGQDVVLGERGGKRFAIGVDSDAKPVLGILERDLAAVTAFKWHSAAFVRGHKGRDWVALKCTDARVDGAEEMNPVPLRLWIPVSLGVLEAWTGIVPAPSKLRLRAVASKRGQPTASDRSPVGEIPLLLKGDWRPDPGALKQ